MMHDHEFLLRCAMTHDWDTLVGFCQFLEDTFSSQTSAQKNRIFAAKHQLTHKDQWGNTALHAACYNTPPSRAVVALLTAARAAHPRPLQVHTMLSRDHSTPLLVACATGASLEVIQALLDPPAGGLVSGGAMVGVADQQGATPLSELAVHYELQRQSPLYDHSPTALPLDQVPFLQWRSISSTAADDPTTTASQQQQQTPTTNNNALLDTFQSKLEALFRASWKDTFPSQPFVSMVHGLANVATSCPPVVTRLILRSYHHDGNNNNNNSTNSETNHHHQMGLQLLPLHLTVSQVPTRSVAHHASFITRHAYCVEQLLQVDPASARTIIPKGAGGRTPFLQAIASGWFWHTSTTTLKNNNNNDDTNKGPVQLLWHQAPEGMAQTDPVTGLPPLLLAATSTWSTTLSQRRHGLRPSSLSCQSQTTQVGAIITNQEAEEQILQIDTLFHLLWLRPQVLAECITS